jgi:hypothetical protein
VLSSLLELAGFAAITGGVYVEAGRGAALLVGGFFLWFLGQATDGVRPLAAIRGRAVGVRVRLAAKRKREE